MQRLVLIDGHAILYRAYHALPNLITSGGQPTNAVYGFLSMMFKTNADLKPSHLAVVFDRPEPTFRKKLYEDYQSQRPKMEENLIYQVGLTRDLIRKIGIPIYEKAGYEADDVIGTLARQTIKSVNGDKESKDSDKIEVVIITGDRDLLQLVNDKVKLFMPVKGISQSKLFGRNEVMEKFGVNPSQIIDFKALIGDPSDNYPGVFGIGPKTAADLIRKYSTLDGIYENLDKLNPKLREKLEKSRNDAYMSYKLAKIVTDVPIEFDIKTAKLMKLDRPDVRQALEGMEFRSLVNRLSGDNRKQASSAGPPEGPAGKLKTEKNHEQTSLF